MSVMQAAASVSARRGWAHAFRHRCRRRSGGA